MFQLSLYCDNSVFSFEASFYVRKHVCYSVRLDFLFRVIVPFSYKLYVQLAQSRHQGVEEQMLLLRLCSRSVMNTHSSDKVELVKMTSDDVAKFLIT